MLLLSDHFDLVDSFHFFDGLMSYFSLWVLLFIRSKQLLWPPSLSYLEPSSSLRSHNLTISDLNMFPESLKSNREIAPYYQRYRELEDVNPIVSYYCKLKVLDTILTNKLHKEKEVETYVLQLLDETESFKNNADEDVTKVLNDKNLSISLVLNFALKIFNQCLNDLSNYDGNKIPLMSKIKACLNFLGLIELFKKDDVDWSKLSGGKADDFESFDKLNKERTKLLKYNLSKLIKDEIEIKGEEEELEKLAKELDGNGLEETDEENGEENEPTLPSTPVFIDDSTAAPDSVDAPFLPSAPKTIGEDLPSAPKDIDEPVLPSTPKDLDQPVLPSAPKDIGDSPNLPGAPHFNPEDSDDLKLPGAPRFLPDDDLSGINKDSSILIIPPEDEKKQSKEKPKPKVEKSIPKPTPPHEELTKEKLDIILNKQETITKIQKLCKFAISALNYEDLKTAEKELTESLELIKLLNED